MPKIWIETTPNDKIAWVHLEPVGKYSYEVSVSEELHARLKDNPLQPDDPMSELLQACIQLGYRLGGEDDF